MVASRVVSKGAPAVRKLAATASPFWPKAYLEYAYYVQLFYAIMGGAIGLSTGGVGAGLLGLLAGLCLFQMGPYWILIARAIALPLACGLSFAAVQVLAHGESLFGGSVRNIFAWMIGLVIAHYVALRAGFLNRCAIAHVLLGMMTLPYLKLVGDTAYMRARLGGGISIANPNDLGAYFGFCAVYLVLLGLETRRLWMRAMAFSGAVGCMLVVGLTVSRAPLLAAACSVLFAFRRVLNRGFFPLLGLLVLAWFAYGFGLFDSAADMYQRRGLEETGRFVVWPLAIRRFLESPLVGVGVSGMATPLPGSHTLVTPHNGFVYFALTSGIVPLLFFTAYWVQLIRTVFTRQGSWGGDAPFLAPLLVYAFMLTNYLNEAWMFSWMVAIFATIRVGGVLFDIERTENAIARRDLYDVPFGGRAVAPRTLWSR